MPLLDLGLVNGRAAWARAKGGYGPDDAPPYSTGAITRGVFPDTLDVSGAPLPKGIVEMVERGPGGRKVIWYNNRVNGAAQRVGIAHGLYHLLSDLRVDEGLRECNVALRGLERQRPDLMPKDPVELACDLFAGELLVPFAVLDRYAPSLLFPSSPNDRALFNDRVDQLATTVFNVPAGFIRWRLWDLVHLRKTHFFTT